MSGKVWDILICSTCGSPLQKRDHGAVCPSCGLEYEYTESGSLDLRLKRPRKYALEFDLGTPLLAENGFRIEPLTAYATPEVDFSSVSVPIHLSRDLLSYFPKAKSQDSLMLDLGCGGAAHRAVCEHAGFEWVGLDHEAARAAILGDAHSLPFKDNTFEFILSIAVLEHIRFPFIMMREAYRVLKPHGKFIGTVAFLEPFHGDSYYHHTHLGTLNSLRYGGFTVEKLAPNEKWTVLVAQAGMALFPRMPRFMVKSVIYPVQTLHELWWRAGSLVRRKPETHVRIRNTTGSFTFIATKGAA
jgi:SAM-dependent methyltransferase